MRTQVLAVLTAVLLGGLVALPGCKRGNDAEDKVQAASAKATSFNNLKQIGIAFFNYADAFDGRLPPEPFPTGKDGKPLLSWRVYLLPYLEHEVLYKQFNLNEPWDGPTNKKLIEQMPKVFKPVRGEAGPGETYYQVFMGEDAVFGAKHKPRFPASFPDGTPNTGLVFEAGTPVVWTKPDDLLPFDENKPLPTLGGMFDGECHVGMADGSVLRLKKGADEKELKKLIMPADGFVIDRDKLGW